MNKKNYTIWKTGNKKIVHVYIHKHVFICIHVNGYKKHRKSQNNRTQLPTWVTCDSVTEDKKVDRGN